MSPVARVAPVSVALALAACQREPPPAEEKVDPLTVVAAIDRKASSYKDPLAPATSPPPGLDPRAPRPAIRPSDVKISGDTRTEAADGLFFRVPVEWVAAPGEPPDMRPGFTLPGPGGEARLEISRASGGEAEGYIRRWREEFRTATGAQLAAGEARVQEMVRGPLKITLVDVAGTYVAPVAPEGTQRHDDPEYRMLAAIVEREDQDFLFKAVGPALTMAIWEQAFADFAASFAVQYQP